MLLHAIGFGIVAAAVTALAAFGFAVQFGVTNILNLAYGDVMTASGFVAYMSHSAGLNPLAGKWCSAATVRLPGRSSPRRHAGSGPSGGRLPRDPRPSGSRLPSRSPEQGPSRYDWPEAARIAAIKVTDRRSGPHLPITVPAGMYPAAGILDAEQPQLSATVPAIEASR